jgi:hypothetical protein
MLPAKPAAAVTSRERGGLVVSHRGWCGARAATGVGRRRGHADAADVHVRSANASSRAPARLLVFMVKDKDRPVSRAVDAPGLDEPR